MKSTYEVGQKLYIGRHGNYSARYSVGEVVKVTPSGLVDVTIGGDPIRFREGKELGGSMVYARFIDRLPFEERTARIKEEERADAAANAIRKVVAGPALGTWQKDHLAAEVARLEVLLAEARAAVEAI